MMNILLSILLLFTTTHSDCYKVSEEKALSSIKGYFVSYKTKNSGNIELDRIFVDTHEYYIVVENSDGSSPKLFIDGIDIRTNKFKLRGANKNIKISAKDLSCGTLVIGFKRLN
jgi:hypothetical protein